MKSIQKIINKLNDKGISAAKMSRDLGFSNAVFYEWKKGKYNPSLEKLRAMSQYLDVPMTSLLDDDEQIEDKDPIVGLSDEQYDLIYHSIGLSSTAIDNIILIFLDQKISGLPVHIILNGLLSRPQLRELLEICVMYVQNDEVRKNMLIQPIIQSIGPVTSEDVESMISSLMISKFLKLMKHLRKDVKNSILEAKYENHLEEKEKPSSDEC